MTFQEKLIIAKHRARPIDKLRLMKPGDKLEFPIEKVSWARMSTAKVAEETGGRFSTWSDRQRRVISILRLK